MPQNDCPDLVLNNPSFNIDKVNGLCGDSCPPTPSQKDLAFLERACQDKTGFGVDGNCDPAMTGQIVQDLSKDPDRNTIFRYSKAFRGCDEAMKDFFTGMIVIDELGVAHPVPIMNANQERAVSAVIQDNVRKDKSAVVDRLKLPLMSIYASDYSYNMSRYTYHGVRNHFRRQDGKPGLFTKEKYERDTVFGLSRGIPIDIGYTLTVWTYFVEDMNQILEQIVTKFSPIGYIRIQGIQWETIVKLDSIANNIDMEPGATANRVVKFQIKMTVETYVPQPIRRDKAVLKTRIELVDSVKEDEITLIIKKLEDAVEELKK